VDPLEALHNPLRYDFHDWRLEVEPNVTREAYTVLAEPDPSCCDACATFRSIVKRQFLPPRLQQFLLAVGADPAKPAEVFGAPESGFINAWWFFVGRVLDGEWAGGGANAYVELSPDAKCWVTGAPSATPPIAFGSHPVCQIEVVWDNASLVAENRRDIADDDAT
jgi:hypothetical protein